MNVSPRGGSSSDCGCPLGKKLRYLGYLYPSAEDVVLGFEYGKMMADPEGILRGSGSQVRTIEISSKKNLRRGRLTPYILEAVHIALQKKTR